MKQKYTSVPSDNQIFKAGALIIAFGFLLNLIPSVKDLADAFWTYYRTDAITAVMNYVLPVTGAVMLAYHEKFGLKFPLLLLIMGTMICGCDKLLILALVLMLISTFAFSFNVKYYYCKNIKTPWLCLLAAIFAALALIIALTRCPEDPTGLEILAFISMIIVAGGVVMIAFFTESVPGANLQPITIGKMNLANHHIGYRIGLALMAIDFIFVVIANRKMYGFALNMGVKEFIMMFYPLIAYFGALYVLFKDCHTRKGWLAALFLMLAYQSGTGVLYVSPVMPTMLFFFMFAVSFGFIGNYPEDGTKKLTFTVFKIITLACLALCIFLQIKRMWDFAEECRQYITPLHELKEEALYPFDESYIEWIKASIKTFLLLVPSLIKMVGLALIILFSGFVSEESVVVWHMANFFNWAKAYIRDFGTNVGDRLKKLAKTVAKVFLIMGLVILIIAAIGIVGYILLRLDGDPLVMNIPTTDIIKWAIRVAFAVIMLWFQAMMLWLIYSVGQVSNDLKDINENTTPGNTPKIDYGKDEDLPEL